jgi:hypothetical protein
MSTFGRTVSDSNSASRWVSLTGTRFTLTSIPKVTTHLRPVIPRKLDLLLQVYTMAKRNLRQTLSIGFDRVIRLVGWRVEVPGGLVKPWKTLRANPTYALAA